VVHLCDDREAIVGHALDEIHLPQRASAIQWRGSDLAGELIELAAAAGGRHPDPSHVIVEVYLGSLDPHRVVQLERNLDKLVAQRLEQVQPTPEGAPEQLEGEVPREVGDVEHGDLDRMHVDVGCFAVQQHGIPAVESLHSPPHS
jgi:hypothetical protein